MGLDTIPDRIDSAPGVPSVITQDWYNVIESVLNEDFCPRDSMGVVTDQEGSLGQLALAWLYFYFMTVYLYDGSNKVSLSAPSAMSSDYVLTLPQSLPSSGNRILKINPDGTTSFFDVDNTSIEVSSNTIQIKDGGVSRDKLAAPNQALSDSTGVAIIAAGSSDSDVLNLECTLVTTGRDVLLALVHDGSTDPAWLDYISARLDMEFMRDGTVIAKSQGQDASTPGVMFYIDRAPSAASHDYKMVATTGVTCNISGLKLLAMEV